MFDASATHTTLGSARTGRLTGVDAVRGLAIVLMVLDHTRDFFHAHGPSPTDLTRTDVALFFTRWVTHFCAPTFVFLAGTSAWFSARRSAPNTLRWLLFTRGLWLVLLEFSLVNFVWHFNLHYSMGLVLQVIWAIGVSMIALSLCVSVPIRVLLTLGLVVAAGHHVLDGIRPEVLGPWAPLWNVLHVMGPVPFGFVVYPLIPWVAVMLLGYCAGPLFARERRRVVLAALGAASCALFVVLRDLNGYGDPRSWAKQASAAFTLLSFLNVSKYPPSLDYLLVMLGVMLLLLAWFDGRDAAALRVLATFGQVPLFAYVLHLALVHLLAGLTALGLGYGSAALTHFFEETPAAWDLGLCAVYVAWPLVLAALYPLCRWFASVKRTRRTWWLSYL